MKVHIELDMTPDEARSQIARIRIAIGVAPGHVEQQDKIIPVGKNAH